MNLRPALPRSLAPIVAAMTPVQIRLGVQVCVDGMRGGDVAELNRVSRATVCRAVRVLRSRLALMGIELRRPPRPDTRHVRQISDRVARWI